MTDLLLVIVLLALAVGLAVAVTMLRMHLRAALGSGCCYACQGTGKSGDAETNGLCWDCRGTGHPHAGACLPSWRSHFTRRR